MVSNKVTPQPFMAVQDPKSKLYQLQQTPAGSTVLTIGAFGSGTQPDLSDRDNFGLAFAAGPNECGADADKGAADASKGGCELFVFGFQPDAQTLIDNTVNMTMNWVNSGASSPTEYSWVMDVNGVLIATSDPSMPVEVFGPSTQVYLRYPATLPT
jgi:hypothetical protein